MTGSANIVCGDMRTLLPQWATDGLQVDTVICDPPYHLASIAKRFGKPGAAPAQHGRDGAAARLSRGFMAWGGDEGTVSFEPETWKLILDVLKPGGRVAAFGGTRTWWRIAAALDAAGFEIEDTIFWIYGQGLVLRKSRMKPAIEPILVCRKPGPVQDLGIEECRVPAENGRYRENEESQDRRYTDHGGTNFAARPGPRGGSPLGRWPANLIHDGSDEVIACFPDAPGQIAAARTDGSPKRAHVYGNLNHSIDPHKPRSDTGSAARFFNACPWDADEEVQRLSYHAKAPGSERCYHCTICDQDCLHADRTAHEHGRDNLSHLHSHPTVKPLSLARHLAKLLIPKGGLMLDPFAGTGSLGIGAILEGRDALMVDRDERYVRHAKLRISQLPDG